MGNFQNDWGAMDSLLDDNGDPEQAPELPVDAKRRVQLLCVQMADYDKEQATELMKMLGIYSKGSELQQPEGPPLAPAHLRERITPSPPPLNQNVGRSLR